MQLFVNITEGAGSNQEHTHILKRENKSLKETFTRVTPAVTNLNHLTQSSKKKGKKKKKSHKEGITSQWVLNKTYKCKQLTQQFFTATKT